MFFHLKAIPVYVLVQSHQVKPPSSVWQKALLTATGSERWLGLVDCGFSTQVALLAAFVLCTPVRMGPKLEVDCSHQAERSMLRYWPQIPSSPAEAAWGVPF